MIVQKLVNKNSIPRWYKVEAEVGRQLSSNLQYILSQHQGNICSYFIVA
jgi:hypothetical protein